MRPASNWTDKKRFPFPVSYPALGVILSAGLLLVGFPRAGYAARQRSLDDGVYSSTQAERARAVYETQCAECHGDALQGASVGSPLKGEDFLSSWSERPLLDLVDKVQNTMPFDAPRSLSRQQAIDLTAYMLEGGSFLREPPTSPRATWRESRSPWSAGPRWLLLCQTRLSGRRWAILPS